MTTPVTPAGSPYWGRATGPADYGGHANKINYGGQSVINDRTDVGAEHIQRLALDMAAVARLQPFCRMRFSIAVAGCTVVSCRLGNAVYEGTGYDGASPPTGFPLVTYIGAGTADVTFASSYSDDYAVAESYTPEMPMVSAESDPYTASAYVSGQNVRVIVSTGGTPTDSGVTLEVS